MGKIRKFINKVQGRFGINNPFGLTNSEIESWDGLPACVESHRELKEGFA